MTCKSSFTASLPTIDKNSLDFEWFLCSSLLILACNCPHPVYVFLFRLSLIYHLAVSVQTVFWCFCYFCRWKDHVDVEFFCSWSSPWRSFEGHCLRFGNSLLPWGMPVISLMLFSFVNILAFYFDTCRILKCISLIKNLNAVLLLLPSYSERPFPPRCCLLSASFRRFRSFSLICPLVCL